jgi:hypothetical protein
MTRRLWRTVSAPFVAVIGWLVRRLYPRRRHHRAAEVRAVLMGRQPIPIDVSPPPRPPAKVYLWGGPGDGLPFVMPPDDLGYQAQPGMLVTYQGEHRYRLNRARGKWWFQYMGPGP